MQTETIPNCQTKHYRGQFSGTLVANNPLGQEYRSFVIEFIGDGARAFAPSLAGQFVQVNCNNPSSKQRSTPFLNRPFSIASINGDQSRCQVEIIHNVIGPGTKKMSQMDVGSDVELVGPLGNGYTLPTDVSQPMILIGGGIGVPPLLFLANQMAKAGFTDVILMIGLRSVTNFDQCIVHDDTTTDSLTPALRLKQTNNVNIKSIIATDNSDFGYKGSIVTAFDALITSGKCPKDSRVFTCGPEGMLKAVVDVTNKNKMLAQVCMEAYMACGFGVCQSCIVSTKVDIEKSDTDENLRYELVCHHGPVFDSNKLVF
jgi:dihydroorotate dehydrogenase electron transfer subunit